MSNFQAGDYCAWNNKLTPGKDNWIVCYISDVGISTGLNSKTYRLKPIERQPNRMSDFWVSEGEVRIAPGFCLVCKRNVGLEDQKLKPHNKGSDLCYGSYMPGL